jgi:hypothetical protein
MKTLIKSLIAIQLLQFQLVSFGQWTTSNIDQITNCKVSMDFIDPSEGLIIFSQNVDDFHTNINSYYYYTIDSGSTWQKFDTLRNVFVNDFDFNCGWGLSCGNSSNKAYVEFMLKLNAPGISFKLSEFKNILQIDIVDSFNAVFLGIDKNDNYSLGLLERDSNSIQLIKHKEIGKTRIKKIKFYGTNYGFYLLADSLFRTDNFGESKELLSKNISNFDFYCKDTGVYIGDGIYVTFNKGDFCSKLSSGNFSPENLIMSSNQSFLTIDNWEGSTQGIYINYGDVFKGLYDYDHIYNGMNSYISYKYFNNKLGYIVTGNGAYSRTSNNGGHNRIIQTDFEKNAISLYPNPTSRTLNLLLPNIQKKNKIYYWITDYNGKPIVSQFFINSSGSEIIDVSVLTPGIYMLNIMTQESLITRKLIKM